MLSICFIRGVVPNQRMNEKKLSIILHSRIQSQFLWVFSMKEEEDAKKYFLINYSSKGKLLLYRRIKGTYQRISKSTNIRGSKKMIRETRKMRKKMHDRASKLSRVEAVMIFLSFLSHFFPPSFLTFPFCFSLHL